MIVLISEAATIQDTAWLVADSEDCNSICTREKFARDWVNSEARAFSDNNIVAATKRPQMKGNFVAWEKKRYKEKIPYTLFMSPRGYPFEFIPKGDGGYDNWAYNGEFSRVSSKLAAGLPTVTVNSQTIMAPAGVQGTLIRVEEDVSKCMVRKQNNDVRMEKCKWVAEQRFYHETKTGFIKSHGKTGCLTQNSINNNVYMYSTCRTSFPRQVWNYDDDGRLRTAFDGNLCLDYWHGNLYMSPCHHPSNPRTNQIFLFNREFWGLGAIYTEYDPLKSVSINRRDGDSPVLMTNTDLWDTDAGGEMESNESFIYDHNTNQIRHRRWGEEDSCISYDSAMQRVIMDKCTAWAPWQKWDYNVFTKEVKNRRTGDDCLDYNYNMGILWMHPCHKGTNQKFFLPFAGHAHQHNFG